MYGWIYHEGCTTGEKYVPIKWRVCVRFAASEGARTPVPSAGNIPKKEESEREEEKEVEEECVSDRNRESQRKNRKIRRWKRLKKTEEKTCLYQGNPQRQSQHPQVSWTEEQT